ncbi:MAG: formyltransferase family protein [Paeniclostridium sordellii]|uniref:Methionyl-tRNA formyltransferase n=1 Tax=Paeniclostridium hominis TaxID=2764329 RepID=A0ABR7K3Y5_9FIRM|nr:MULTISPECIES: formyltransferase family protein [Paeniclostridium]MBC6003818.1 methionyl-tRNA formyltransferase [Paeniclostridium hominis]MDU2592528.1 formyltransferase family protein [Paeniclostridium sordellii]
MKIAFATVVQLGLSCIEEIYRIGGELELLITLEDERAKHKSGRIYLDEFSNKHNIPLVKIENINQAEVINALKEKDIDWLFIIGWSQIAKKELLDTPKLGCLGMHPTLLPMGRGRAAIPWAIIKGLEKTGVTMFKLDEGVDTGLVLGQVEISIEERENATTLYKKVNSAHITLMEKYWNDIVNNNVTLEKQNESLATYWEGRQAEDGRISNQMTCLEADRLVRAVTKPYPGAFYEDNNKKIIIWTAKTATGEAVDESISIKLKDGYIIPIDYEIEILEVVQ